MDRDRLKQVHQTELTESRINEDFVDWLKTKGPSWLLMLMVVLVAYLGIVRWKQHKRQYFEQAWAELLACRLPGSFEDVAERYADVYGLPQLARRQAADTLLQAIQVGRPLGFDPTAATPPTLTGEEHQEYLDRAERLYEEVLEGDLGTLPMTLHAVTSLSGLAAVAEARGEAEQARQWYEEAAARADPHYPHLADRLRRRSTSVEQYEQEVALPAERPPAGQPQRDSLAPIVIDDALRDLLLPIDTGSG